MGNLIRAEFYRIRCQRWGFYGLTGSVLGGVVLLTLLCAFPPQSGDAALLFQTIEYSAIVGMVLAVPCADLASARVDGRQVLLKNEAVFGIPRWQMYLSRLFTALLLGGGAGGGYESVRPAFGGDLPPGDRSAAPDPVPVCPADADCPPPVDGLRRTVPVPEIYLPLRGRCGDSGGALLSGGIPHCGGRRPRWSPPIRESPGPSAPCSMPSTP